LLIGPGKPAVGAYGGIGVAYTHMLHRDGVVTDLEAAVIIAHRLSLGLAGYVFSRTPSGPPYAGTPREFGTGYGGLLLRYAAFAQDFPIYVSFGALIGGGVLSLHPSPYSSTNQDYYYPVTYNDGFFVFQPDLSLHANATRWLRFSVTGGYRMATAAHHFAYDGAALGGGVVGASIDLGWF
jgi:hypothetical protein